MKRKTGLSVCLLYGTVNLFAQTIELDPVTVAASLSQQKVSATGKNIITLDETLFSRLPVHSIDELLRYLPGVEVQARGPQGAQSDLLIRGGTFQHPGTSIHHRGHACIQVNKCRMVLFRDVSVIVMPDGIVGNDEVVKKGMKRISLQIVGASA